MSLSLCVYPAGLGHRGLAVNPDDPVQCCPRFIYLFIFFAKGLEVARPFGHMCCVKSVL